MNLSSVIVNRVVFTVLPVKRSLGGDQDPIIRFHEPCVKGSRPAVDCTV